MVTVGYAGFGVIESGSNNSADLVFVSVDDEGSSNITLGKLGIEITGTTAQFTYNTLTETEYSYSEDDSGNFDLSSETQTSYSSSKTIVNGTIKIGLTVNLDSSYDYDNDSSTTDTVPNIANLDYDLAAYSNLKVVFGFNSEDVQYVTADIYPTNYPSQYSAMTVETTSATTSKTFTFPLKSQSTDCLYSMANYDKTYPVYDSSGNISNYAVPITIEFDCTGISTLSSSSFYSPSSSTTFTATFSIEGS